MPAGAGLSSAQYLPRVMAYEPPAVRSAAPLPVLVYRELLELPALSAETISTIRDILAQQARTEQVRVVACGVRLLAASPRLERHLHASVCG